MEPSVTRRVSTLTKHFADGLQFAPTSAALSVGSELQHLLDHDCREERQRMKDLMRDPLFTPRWAIPIDEERDLALKRLQVLFDSGNFSVNDFRTNPLRIFAAHECMALADVSAATKLTVQVNLFAGTVIKLGTKHHHDMLISGIDALTDIGCFGLTELVSVLERPWAAPLSAATYSIQSFCCGLLFPLHCISTR